MISKGIDPQLERAITEIKNALKNKGYSAPKQPGMRRGIDEVFGHYDYS